MKYFFIYLFWGFVGLAVRVSFPQVQIEWLWISLVYAQQRGGMKLCIPLLVILVLGYAAFSLAPAWQIGLPLLLGISVFELLHRHLNLPSPISTGLLLIILWVSEWILRQAPPISLQEILWGLGTVAMGVLGIPLAQAGIRRVLGKIFPVRTGIPEHQVFRFRSREEKNSSNGRRPFGFEKLG